MSEKGFIQAFPGVGLIHFRDNYLVLIDIPGLQPSACPGRAGNHIQCEDQKMVSGYKTGTRRHIRNG